MEKNKVEGDIYDLKTHAHELIEDIVLLGMHRNRIYRRLSKMLGVKLDEAHIGSMAAMSQVKRAITCLYRIKYKTIGHNRRKKNIEKNLLEKQKADERKAQKEKERAERIARGETVDTPKPKKKSMGISYAPNIAELQKLASQLNTDIPVDNCA